MKDRIISLMKHMGMSQKVFAAEIRISEGALSSIFSGRTKPTLNTVNSIHERFPEVASVNVSPQMTGIPIQTSFIEPLLRSQQVAPQNNFSSSETKILDKPMRRIAEIRVFYDDGTFETFSPKQ